MRKQQSDAARRKEIEEQLRIETEKNIVYAVDGETQETKVVEVEICPKMVKFFRPKN